MRAIILSAAVMAAFSARAQEPPHLEWQRCYGGSGNEGASDLLLLPDGGALITGLTNSNNGDVSGFHGGSFDIWALRVDAAGDPVWQRCLGGSGGDVGGAAVALPDGGFIVVGSTNSNNGDVSGNHGQTDGWVVKLSATGAVEWQRCFGGSSGEGFYDVGLLPGGDLIAVGASRSTDGDVPLNRGSDDAWAVRFDAQGNLQWSHTYGSSYGDVFYGMHITGADEVLAIGYAEANDGDVSGHHGDGDVWVARLDGSGALITQHCYGGGLVEHGDAVLARPTGGAVCAGYTNSPDGDVAGWHGQNDAWVLDLSANGQLNWQRTLGGSDLDGARSLALRNDGRLVIGGSTRSADGDVQGQPEQSDTWIVQLLEDGTIDWQVLLGGSGSEGNNSIRIGADGTLFALGGTTSNDGDVSGNHGGTDLWLVRLATGTGTPDHPLPSIGIRPVPATDALTIRLPEGWAGPADCALYDPSGRLVQRQALSAKGPEHRIGIGALPPGNYTMVLRSQQGLARGRVIKVQ